MSNQASYGYPSGVRPDVNMAYASPQPSRRTVGGSRYEAYATPAASGHMDPRLQASRRPMSSSSSLAGAMGDSPSPEMAWSPSPEHREPYATGQPSGMAYNAPTTTNYYQDVITNPILSSPESVNVLPPNASQTHQYAYHHQRATPTMQPVPAVAVKAEASAAAASRSSSGSSRNSPENELLALRKRVRELELVNDSSRNRITQLEQELAHSSLMPSGTAAAAPATRAVVSGMTGLPSPAHSPVNSASFQASWAARTEARVKQFCSLNRAGNALCSWHETRRERRAYPPRAAPPGYLNCGCTYEEALFEESLARHNVGSYYPGENVRMDPALRNPLLQLLQQRYGYRDGDFEIDPVSGTWQEGEGPLFWEQRVLHGASTKRTRNLD